MSNAQPMPNLGWKKWVIGARPRTLPAAVVPVVIGAAVALDSDNPVWWRLVLAAIVSVSLQVGVNYANDYSDGVRGTDDDRVGPMRLVGSGVASAVVVKRAAFIALGIAAVAGLVLAVVTTLMLLVVGVAAIVAAWTYTGGPRPYGYAGLGEVFVFVFFGVVATVGTQYALTEEFSATGWWASIGVGAFACALLVINNLRDIPGDTAVGKRTLAVKLGDIKTRLFFTALVFIAAVVVCVTAVTAGTASLIGFIGIIAARPALRLVAGGAHGKDLIAVLAIVGRAQMIFGITYGAGLAIALLS